MKKPNFVKKTQPVFKKCSKVPLSLALAGAFFAPGLAATESRNVDLEEMAKDKHGPLLASHFQTNASSMASSVQTIAGFAGQTATLSQRACNRKQVAADEITLSAAKAAIAPARQKV